MSRITISLSHAERDALSLLAKKEFRDLRTQAKLIIYNELISRGLLPDPDRETSVEEIQESASRIAMNDNTAL